MPRKLRLEMPGGVYHVINRGNYRQDLFTDPNTHRAFENCLFETCEKTNWILEGFCVMQNHFHLVIRTPEGNLSYGMQWLTSTWANRFNRFRNVNGKLFQDRFKSLIVDDENYLGKLLDYVHLNPVRAGICPIDKLHHYRWSSYWYLQNKKMRPGFLKVADSLYLSGKWPDNIIGRKYYQEYLKWINGSKEAQQDALFKKMSHGWAIGEKEFKEKLIEKIEDNEIQLSKGDEEGASFEKYTQTKFEQWESLVNRHMKALGKDMTSVQNDTKSAEWKVMIATSMKNKCQASNAWLSDKLNMGAPSSMSRSVSKFIHAGGVENRNYKRLQAEMLKSS